ncbi:MAG: hypothetical protein K2P09_00280 [Erysipelotrichales bacterium]|nr:hypothetical protein [Erysipelotrichales bacterium]
MKKIGILIIGVATMFLIIFLIQGKDATREISQLNMHSEEEIQECMDITENVLFPDRFPSADLKKMKYIETEDTLDLEKHWAKKSNYEKTIYMTIDYTMKWEGSGILPEKFSQYTWIIGKNSNQEWKLIDCGYGI